MTIFSPQDSTYAEWVARRIVVDRTAVHEVRIEHARVEAGAGEDKLVMLNTTEEVFRMTGECIVRQASFDDLYVVKSLDGLEEREFFAHEISLVSPLEALAAQADG